MLLGKLVIAAALAFTYFECGAVNVSTPNREKTPSVTNIQATPAPTPASISKDLLITLERGPDSVVLGVSDNGRGFAEPPQEHGGLRSMRERALLIDGALAVKASRRGGVHVRLEVPAPAAVEAVGVGS